jgi:uncharacterized protein (DUF1330 family)
VGPPQRKIFQDTTMTKRLVSAGIFISLYLIFLAWYDGWGKSPMTAAEVEQYLSNVPHSFERGDFRDRIRKLGADDDGGEIFMLNLNRYKYAADEPRAGAPAAYQSYGASVIGMILENAGHPIYSGEFFSSQITEASDKADWDEVILVRYRSRRDFLSMVTSDAYQEIARDRTSGIAYARVAPSVSTLNLVTPRLVVLILLLAPGLLFDYLLRRKTA